MCRMCRARSPRHSHPSTHSDCVQYKRIYSTAVVEGTRCSSIADATSFGLCWRTHVSLTLLKRKQTCWFSTTLKVTTSSKTIWTCSSKQTNTGTVSHQAGCLFYSVIRDKRGLSLGLKQQLAHGNSQGNVTLCSRLPDVQMSLETNLSEE